MKEMLSSGTTLLLVSHTIETVKTMCDHALWLNKGKVVEQGDAKTVCEHYAALKKKP